jgi:hypothetical protein
MMHSAAAFSLVLLFNRAHIALSASSCFIDDEQLADSISC